MRVDLRTHPKVVRMAGALKADRLRVLGGLFSVWSIFDAHSIDGVLEGYSFAAIDDDLGWKGFGKAMSAIDWLVELPDGLEAPRFDEHNGKSAKRRASETARKAAGRELSGDARTKSERVADWRENENGHLSASNADAKRAREEGEKRREELSEAILSEDKPLATPAGAVCLALKRAGIPGVSPSHPKLLALLQAGATTEEFVDAAAKGTGKAGGFAYVLGVVEGRRRDAAQMQVANGPLARPKTFREIDTENAEKRFAEMVGSSLPAFLAPNGTPDNVIDMEPGNVPAIARPARP